MLQLFVKKVKDEMIKEAKKKGVRIDKDNFDPLPQLYQRLLLELKYHFI